MKHLIPVVLIILSFSSKAQDWKDLPRILSNIQAPGFPDRDINIVSIGAPTNGTTLSTTFIQKAIDSCNKLGGGRVVIPAGSFLTGAITLKSNVNLYIASGATLKFSTNTANYLPAVLTRFEGVECYNFSPFIYSYGAENIALTGSGTLNGQASNTNWWAWKTTGTADNNLLNTMGENGTPVEQRIFGSGHKIRPVFIQFYKSKNILIDSVTIINSPMWEINPVLSENITVQNITVNSHGPNNDGCNPECCKNVLIYKCSFNTGDDCIAIKSGRNNDGRRINVPSENIVIQNCTMIDGHGGITMGSECSGGIRNVYAENCTLSSPDLTTALRIKTNSVRGGTIENIFMRNCIVDQVSSEVVQVDMYYQEGDAGAFTPTVRNIVLNNITSNKSSYAFTLRGYQRSPVTDIKITDCTFNNAGNVGTLSKICRMQVYNSFVNGNIPLIPATVQGYIEGEAYSAKAAWGWSNVQTGFNGNGYMEPADSNNFIDFTINKNNNEIDSLLIRYANNDTFNKPCIILVNGINAGQFNFMPTQSTWKTERKNITLRKGNNTIRLVSSYNLPVYIDRFSINRSVKCFCPDDDALFISEYKGDYAYQWQVYTDTGYTNLTDDSIYNGVNNDTLFLAKPSTSWYGKRYRCSINNGSLYSNEYELKFATSWSGTSSTSWEDPTNWDCNSIPDENTDVIVNNINTNMPVVHTNAFCRSLQAVTPATVTVDTDATLTVTANPK